LNHDSIHFVIGAGVSVNRTVISNVSALRLTSPAKTMLVKSPASFVSSYGPYVVSELVYGAKFLCRYSLKGRHREDGAYLRNLFKSITADVFFNASMAVEFESKLQQAVAESKLVWPNFECRVSGGPRVAIPPLPAPLELGKIFQTWNQSLLTQPSSLAMQRLAVQPISELQVVKEVLLNKSSTEALPISSVQRITAKTTQSLSNDLALAAFAKNSAQTATDYDCAKINITLRSALGDVQDAVTRYAIRTEMLSGADWSNMQVQFGQSNYSWLEGHDLIGRYGSLMKYCDATSTTAPVTTSTTTSANFLPISGCKSFKVSMMAVAIAGLSTILIEA